MKRLIDFFLLEWKHDAFARKPLLLRGARQVGKTYAARTLGKTFTNFIEINLETDEGARAIIAKDLDVKRIVFQLSQYLHKDIIPGSTLLFFDEIQIVPQAITALRYFYELMPELHVIAAGSLLDFAVEHVGMPVGRVSSLYMYPLSFIEFCVALGNEKWAQAILNHDARQPFLEPVHDKLLYLIGTYLALGGMPGAVYAWVQTQDPRQVKRVHADLLESYQQDFNKYAKTRQIKYLALLFHHALNQLSNKFMFSRVGEYQKRELAPALELLQKAGLMLPVVRNAGQEIPLSAQADLHDFKIIFLDIGLSQASLNLDVAPWFIDPLTAFVNKGALVEAFVGQELRAYTDPIAQAHLYYWRNQSRAGQAEVDYLVQLKEKVVPIEVKAGTSLRIKSMNIFLDSHEQSLYGIRFSANNFVQKERVHTYPLYAIAKSCSDATPSVRDALKSLVGEK
jgi:uncharacterized protein